MKPFFFALLSLFGLVQLSISQDFGRKQTLNANWYFNLGDVQYGGREYMDCSKWQKVELPHDWSVRQHASPELASCTGYLPGGIGWYRQHLQIPAEEAGNKVYIYFEGVYNNSEVFINGKWLGKRPNGYISFLYDLTPYIKWGEENSIAVRVDHSNDADSRWYTGSGIYRDVHLVYANPVHINLWGVSYQAQKKGNGSLIQVQTSIKNNSEAANLRIVYDVLDVDGRTVATATVKGSAVGQAVTEFKQALQLSQPNLWSTKNPYLYTLKTTVYKGSKQVDESTIPLGIRYLHFDASTGFSLNGENMKIKGVCLHHDAGVLGAAVPKSVWRYRLQQLKSLGCNAIRTSHNPQATDLYDLCDELGFLVMDEAFDEWEYPKNKWIEGWNKGKPGHQGSSDYFREWGARDLKDMVLRDRKHPSIFMWSIGNEVDYPNDPYSHPILDDEGIGQHHTSGFKSERPRAERLGEIATELVEVVKKADSSRPVTAALAGAVMSNFTDYPFVLDVVGYNYTENKYDEHHQTYPERILYGSENRHDLPAWYAVKNNEFIFGQFLWTGFDYLGESGPWPSRGFTTGLINLAGDIKPRGYFRKALWSDEPMVYLGSYRMYRGNWVSMDAPHTWNYDKNANVRVACYTNCDEAELWLNGEVIGKKKAYDEATGIIYWDVTYAPGELKVVAYKNGEMAARDSIFSNTMPASISVDAWPATDGGNFRILEVNILDANGNKSILADNEIHCRISGGTLLGLENASNNAADDFLDSRQRCINGKLLIYARKDADKPMTVRLYSPLLESVQLEVN